jgi:branched-chain amino acid transport system substrate-binding protein
MKRRASAIALAAVLGAVGVTSAGVTSAVSQSSDQTPVRIGVLEDMTGPLSSIGGPGNVVAAQMAVEDFGGKVLGRKIEIVSGDDQNKPDVGLGVVRRWFDVENVVMVTGLGNSGVALAIQNLARERKRVDIVIGAAAQELSTKQCSPTGFQWNWDAHAVASTVVNGLMDATQAKSWYFLTVDYAFGHSVEREATAIIKERDGKVAGSARHPLGTADFASFMLQAQASKADVVAFANVSADLVNSVKASREFGIVAGGQKLAAFILQQAEVSGLGLDVAKGLVTTSAFFYGMNDDTRAFGDRYASRFNGRLPGTNQAGVYSAVLHYLKAMQAAGTDSGETVAVAMRRMPVTDFVNKEARIRADGRLLRDLFLVEVKSPEESKFQGDFYKVLAKVGPEKAFAKISDECVIPKSAE